MTPPPKNPQPVRLTAASITPAGSVRVRSSVRAGFTIKQKVTENA